MGYLVTGATGFIGRHLIERLLEREGEIYLLVRASSTEKVDRLSKDWGSAADRVHTLIGDLGSPNLGLDDGTIAQLDGKIDHFFHLAAVYDMTAPEERNRVANVEGTRHAVALANAVGAGRWHS